ncbi:phosphotransferase [Bradyrhizobium sp. SZCCHNRI3052]|uniref:phosphotransferase n=1 Tax=Bradyrhizobium sp. SZCCHNRI3052 TaxID=3057295 RepID=UPI002916BCB9|nr:phosphotransferase [Bradyrhizobium sp. SZCCHNRI3052]
MHVSKIVPEARLDDVRAALKTVFGTWNVAALQPLKGGVSGALILRFEVRERDYVLRIEPERVALQDRQRGLSCMTTAAAVGAAPAVHYSDAATGLSVMDFVPNRPLAQHPDGLAGAVRALGKLTAQLQSSPPFPIMLDYPELIQNIMIKLVKSGRFASGQLDRHAEGLALIRAALPWDSSSLVSSHNDPNVRNILFDGKHVWLVDWELAWRNDPLVDLAILTIEVAESAELEAILLETAFGAVPDRRLRARLSVIRLLTRLFYGCIVLDSLLGTLHRSASNEDLAGMTPIEFRAAVAEGRLASGSPDVAYAFAKMSLTAFITGLAAPGFSEMLEVVKQG